MSLPQDPFILLSYLNTQLRDHYASLEELCAAEGIEEQALDQKMEAIGYRYDRLKNRFA